MTVLWNPTNHVVWENLSDVVECDDSISESLDVQGFQAARHDTVNLRISGMLFIYYMEDDSWSV